MAAFTSRKIDRATLTLWMPTVGGAVAALATAGLFLLMPTTMLEDWVWRSGLPALIAAAEPPLGMTARSALALSAGTVTGAVTWSALFLLFGPEGLLASRPRVDEGVPVLRRADAHPDAPARRPLSAADLGTPEPPALSPPPPPMVQAIPANLDLPLAAYHPGALPDVPREPVRPVASLRPVALEKGERIASVQLPRSPQESTTAPSIEALLKRLEQGTRRPLRVQLGNAVPNAF